MARYLADLELFELQAGAPVGPQFEHSRRTTSELAVASWVEGSRSLRAICEARGILYVHVLQPTLHDEGSKPLTAAEIAPGAARPAWVKGVHAIYPQLRRAELGLSEEGEHFIDASQLFAEQTETLYRDACHFVARGSELLAVPIAEGLGAALEESGSAGSIHLTR